MSVHVVSWAWKQKLGDPGLKLVLVKLADNADDEGYSWWGQKRLADECEISRPTVQRKLKRLGELGYIEVVERRRPDGGRAANGYRIKAPPHQSEAGSLAQGEAAPASSGEAPKNHQKNRKGFTPPAVVDGVAVTGPEVRLAADVLEELNRQADTNFTSGEWLRSIIMRIRSHPELDVPGYAAVIEKMLARPWWDGDFSPSVIFGNDRVFERALNAKPPKEKGGDLDGYATA